MLPQRQSSDADVFCGTTKNSTTTKYATTYTLSTQFNIAEKTDILNPHLSDSQAT